MPRFGPCAEVRGLHAVPQVKTVRRPDVYNEFGHPKHVYLSAASRTEKGRKQGKRKGLCCETLLKRGQVQE